MACATLLVCFTIPAFVIGAERERVSRLKNILSQPVPLKHFVFERIIVREQHMPMEIEAKNGVKLTRRTNDFFYASLQDDSWFSVSFEDESMIEDFTNLHSTNFIVTSGVFESKPWTLTPAPPIYVDGVRSEFRGPSALTTYITPNDAYQKRSAGFRKRQLLMAAQWGFHDVRPHSVQWEGNSFTARSLGDQPVSGKLHLDQRGAPKTLAYGSGSAFNWRITYNYDKTESVLPDSFQLEAVDKGGGASPLSPIVTRVLHREESPSRLNAAHFSPDQFIDPKLIVRYEYSNGVMFAVELDNEGRFDGRTKVTGRLEETPTRGPNWILLTLFALPGVLILIFASRRKKDAH